MHLASAMHDLKAIRRAYLAGATIPAICECFGCSAHVVREARKGLKRRRPTLSPAQRGRIRRLAVAGVSQNDIRKVTGHCLDVIRREMRTAHDELARLRDEVDALRAVLSTVS